MNISKKFHSILIASLVCAVSAGAADAKKPDKTNKLSAAQIKKGWVLLFNGKDLTGWRPYAKNAKIGPGWEIKDGILIKKPGVAGGDIMTVRKFENFDLNWDWKIKTGGNSGIKYMITEERGKAVGHEYQMLDDKGWAAAGHKLEPKNGCASFYDVLPPRDTKPMRAPGEWNHSRIFVKDGIVEHWLNKRKVLVYRLGREDVLAAVQKSKFKDIPGFGSMPEGGGHILLTDHKDECHFKNIRILEYKKKAKK